MTERRVTGPVPRAIALLACGIGVASVTTLLLVLVVGGGAPQAPLAGLPPANTSVRWALDVAPLVADALGALTVGFALLAGRFLDVTGSVPEAAGITGMLAAAWVGVGVLTIALTAVQAAELTARGDVLGDLAGSAQLQALTAMTLLAAAAALVVRRTRWLALPLAIAALVPTTQTGHVRGDASPVLSGAALAVHVVAASVWVGGLVALTWLALRHRSRWQASLTRYSAMALWCVLALVATGTIVTLLRVHSFGDLFGSWYGLVVVMKALVLLTLAAIGLLQRRHVVGREGRLRDFLLLACSEVTLMALAFGLAAGLALTPPPR